MFFKAAAMAMVCVILYLVLCKQNKDIAILLTIVGCCVILAAAGGYLESVLDFLDRLRSIGGLDTQLVEILLKATGISILADFCAMICTDAGNSAIGKAIQIFSAAIILWMSLPLFSNLIELVTKLLGNI